MLKHYLRQQKHADFFVLNLKAFKDLCAYIKGLTIHKEVICKVITCAKLEISILRYVLHAAVNVLKVKKKPRTTRDNVLLDPRQRLFNNFEKVQFWAKFDVLTPMGSGQELSQRQHIHSRKCLISV